MVDDEPESVVDSLGVEDKTENEQSQDQVMDIVTEIAAETPAEDYMQNIWQLRLRDLREACLEYIRWPETKQAPCVRSESSIDSV